MDQMPVPIAPAPPSSQTARVQPLAAVTRPARSRAAYDANMAINTESTTSAWLYEPVKFMATMGLAQSDQPVLEDCQWLGGYRHWRRRSPYLPPYASKFSSPRRRLTSPGSDLKSKGGFNALLVAPR